MPDGITLGAGEEVLWAGGPARIPWWFGSQDVYVSASALVWLAVVAGLASADGSPRRRGWQQLTWPASTVTPPAFIGLAEAEEVAGLVGAAQLSARAPVKG